MKRPDGTAGGGYLSFSDAEEPMSDMRRQKLVQSGENIIYGGPKWKNQRASNLPSL